MTAKLKKILIYVGVSATGIFSVLLLISFITAQMKLIQVLSPPSSADSVSGSKESRDLSASENRPSSGPLPGSRRPMPPSDYPPADRNGADQIGTDRNPVRPTPIPSSAGTDWPAGLENPQDNPSGQISGPSGPGSDQNKQTYTPPPPSWNKPFVPYKRYKEGEQPPWARPTKYVVEMRKNDPNFNLLDELDKKREELTREAEKEQNQ